MDDIEIEEVEEAIKEVKDENLRYILEDMWGEIKDLRAFCNQVKTYCDCWR